jgi:hypothetical protein
MFSEEESREDDRGLSELETALAALVPRATGLNRDRLMFLAGQASVAAEVPPPIFPSRNRAHWGWPAALATMTAIAASLLVALVLRQAPQVAQWNTKSPSPAAPAAPWERTSTIAQDQNVAGPSDELLALAPALPDWLAWTTLPQAAAGTPRDPSYAECRNQVLLGGIELWAARAPQSAAASYSHEQPPLSREQLNRWLERNDEGGTGRGISAPPSPNLSGDKS